MCTPLKSGSSQALFDYVLQQRQELRDQQRSSQELKAGSGWPDSNEPLSIDNHQRSNLKRTMSRRGAIGFACSFTQSCIETANYFYDNSSDDSFVPMQHPPERSGSSAKKRCRLGRANSSGSHQRHLDDAVDQFAAVAISDVSEEAEAEDMERSVRRKMHMEEFSNSQHTFTKFDEAESSIDTAGHQSVSHLLHEGPSHWTVDDDDMQQSDTESTMTMDDL